MDFELSEEQQDLLTEVDAVVEASGGLDRAFEISRVAGYDGELDTALRERGVGRGQALLERVLIAEHLAGLGVATTYGIGLVLLDDVSKLQGAITVADSGRQGPVRYGSFASTLIILDGETHALAEVDGEDSVRVRSGFGYPYARLNRPDALSCIEIRGTAELRSRWRLALAAEISGNAMAAIGRTAEHLQQRRQFGRPLSTFQALRHRLADAAVLAEATRWMVREAAFTGSAHDIDVAAFYAADTAAKLAPELVQMCGARSFAIAFGMHVFTMRLTGIRLELGGLDRLAVEAVGQSRRRAADLVDGTSRGEVTRS
jgi:alkylation response protein AidB-like acyl-CoA dehydrogenase